MPIRLFAFKISILFINVLSVIGCKDDGNTEDPGIPVPMEITMGQAESITTLDPSYAYDNQTWLLLLNIGEALYRFKPLSTVIEPALAVAMPQKSADGTEYTIQIKPGVLFADGTEVTAESFRYTFTRSTSINDAMIAAGLRGLDPYYLVSSYVKDVVVVDTYTVKYVLHAPFAFFTSLLCQPIYMPQNPSFFPADKVFDSPFQQIEDQALWHLFFLNQNTAMDVTKLMGIGPYRVDSIEYDESMSEFGFYTKIVLVKNPQYHGTPAKNDKIIMQFFLDRDLLESSLASGAVDVAQAGLNPDNYADYKLNPQYKVFDGSGISTQLLGLNHSIPPFDNLTVRRALAFAVDRDTLTTGAAKDTATPLYSPIPNGMWSHKDTFPSRDVTQAASLLDGLTVDLPIEMDADAGVVDAGVEPFTISATNKLPIDFYYAYIGGEATGEVPLFAQATKEAIEETGFIDVTIRLTDWTDFVNMLFGSEMGMYQVVWAADYVDPDSYVFFFGHSAVNFNGYNNPQMDLLLEEAGTTLDDAKRTELYEQVQDLWAADITTIPLFQPIRFVVAQNNINLVPASTAGVMYYSLIERLPQ